VICEMRLGMYDPSKPASCHAVSGPKRPGRQGLSSRKGQTADVGQAFSQTVRIPDVRAASDKKHLHETN
jgi:hypothetical protein